MNRHPKTNLKWNIAISFLMASLVASASASAQTRWHQATLPDAFSTANYRSVVYTGAKFVAVGSGGAILTSTDGVAWTAASDAGVFATDSMSGVDGDINLLVAVSGEGGLFSSPDGDHWTLRDRPAGASFGAVSRGNITSGSSVALGFVAVGASGAVYATTSSDARIWSPTAR